MSGKHARHVTLVLVGAALEEAVRWYQQGASLSELVPLFPISLSTIRKSLILAGVLRSQSEAQRLRLKMHGNPNKGKKHGPRSAETRAILRVKALERGEKTARGVRLKPCGYLEITRGPDKARPLHRVLMEQHLGRRLARREHVHHIDGNRTNNAIENLLVLPLEEHIRWHRLRDTHMRERTEDGRFA